MQECNRNLNISEHRKIFEKWLVGNDANLNPNQTADDYFSEYLESVKGAKTGIEESAVACAAALAKEGQYPLNLKNLPNQELTLLAALCFNLQQLNNREGKFFLGLKDIIYISSLTSLHLQQAEEFALTLRIWDPQTNKRRK